MNFSHCIVSIRVAEAYSSKNQAKVVQKLDSAIHRIHITGNNCFIRWIAIYPLDSAIHRLNNWDQAPLVEKVDNIIQCMDKSLSNG